MNKKGFTLTELIAVVAIIGIIMLITIPVINNMLENNKQKKYMNYVSLVEKALYTYADMEMYTPEGMGLVKSVRLTDLIDGGYIKSFDDSDIYAKFYGAGETVMVKFESGKVEIDEIEIKFIRVDNNRVDAVCTKNECS